MYISELNPKKKLTAPEVHQLWKSKRMKENFVVKLWSNENLSRALSVSQTAITATVTRLLIRRSPAGGPSPQKPETRKGPGLPLPATGSRGWSLARSSR